MMTNGEFEIKMVVVVDKKVRLRRLAVPVGVDDVAQVFIGYPALTDRNGTVVRLKD